MNRGLEYWENKRPQMVKDKVAELMQPKGEYNPFGFKNFTEALQNFSDPQYFVLAAYAGTANELNHETSRAMLGGAMLKFLHDYWKKQAEEKAEELVPSVEELDADSKGEHCEGRR